ncbi:MAG TPA: nicotinate-nucleotide adenylyltransferase [Thermoanaerobaculia bacterium]|nr:nicotinate-nucleotide adenylyltransferase [Thermoanaerobaculia bacterium]
MKIGLSGGTFDPFHRGHLEPVLAVRGEMGWERVIFIPARVQPFKQGRATVSAYHRFAMAVLATQDLDDVTVSPMELEREAVSYTVDTLEVLRREHPEATLDWIIGDDNLRTLHEWKSVGRIFELANLVVLVRGGIGTPPPIVEGRVAAAGSRGKHGCIVFANNAAVAVSSTEIRERLKAGQPVDAFVDPRVSRYIQRNGLYR